MERETAGQVWPEPLAQCIGAALELVADLAEPNEAVVPGIERALAAVPGIDDARLAGRDETTGSPWATRIPVGPDHLLLLRGPAASGPDIVQAAGLLARALASRLGTAGQSSGGPAGPPITDLDRLCLVICGQAPFLIAVHDKDDTLRWMNRPIGEGADPPTDGEPPAPVQDRIWPDDRHLLTAVRQRLIAESADLAEVDVRFTGPTGERRVAHIIVRNLTSDPVVGGLVSYATDVTALQDAEYRTRIGSARLRTLIDSIDVAILVVDENMHIADINPKALALMRINTPPATAIGLDLSDLAQQGGDQSMEVLRIAGEFAERGIAGGVPVYGEEIQLPDGMVVEADYLPIDLDGTVRGHLMVGREVTERVVAQQALEARNRELADLAMLKNEFLATVSHELRTPLTAASSLLELLSESDAAPPLPGDIVEALRRNTKRLLAIVEDLLVLARFEANQFPLDMRVVPTGMLTGAGLDRLRAEAAELGMSITEVAGGEEAPTQLLGDQRWLENMVRHVVSESLIPATPGGKVILREGSGAGSWTLTVSGGAQRTAEYNQDSQDSAVAGRHRGRIGIGLGLTLARAIARRHGGDLRIEPAAAGASTVTISLPAH